MLVLFFIFLQTSTYEISIGNYQIFCLGEDLIVDTLVLSKFKILDGIRGTFTILITDSTSEEILKVEGIREKKHTFITTKSGPHQFCIMNNVHNTIVLEFEVFTGVAAKDFSELPQAKDIKESEKSVKKIKELVLELQTELQAIKERDAQMTNTNETIGSRVISYSLLTIVMLLGLATVQTGYLKRFLRNKKMI